MSNECYYISYFVNLKSDFPLSNKVDKVMAHYAVSGVHSFYKFEKVGLYF